MERFLERQLDGRGSRLAFQDHRLPQAFLSHLGLGLGRVARPEVPLLAVPEAEEPRVLADGLLEVFPLVHGHCYTIGLCLLSSNHSSKSATLYVFGFPGMYGMSFLRISHDRSEEHT